MSEKTTAGDELPSERSVPTLLPQLVGRFDMVAMFVFIVVYAVQASVVQGAGPAAFLFWALGFITLLIPSALATAQLGMMFPSEGAIYVWTHRAFGTFRGFFAGFTSWWPGLLIMISTGGLIVSMIQFVIPSALQPVWQQGLVVLVVIWISAGISILRYRIAQNMVNGIFFVYGAGILLVVVAGLVWVLGGHRVANDFSTSAFVPNAGNWTFYGLVCLALLGAEVPLNLGAEIKERRSITGSLFWGCVATMLAYPLLTLGAMLVVPQRVADPTTAILQAVQIALGWPLAWVATIMMIAFFLFSVAVYNFSYARLLMTAGIDRMVPGLMGRLNRNRVPDMAILTQTLIMTVVTVVIYFFFAGSPNLSQSIFLVVEAAAALIWTLSTAIIFADVLVLRNKYPTEFRRVRMLPVRWLPLASVVGLGACFVGIYVTLTASWNPNLIPNGRWLVLVAIAVGASLGLCLLVYLLAHRRPSRASGDLDLVPTHPRRA